MWRGNFFCGGERNPSRCNAGSGLDEVLIGPLGLAPFVTCESDAIRAGFVAASCENFDNNVAEDGSRMALGRPAFARRLKGHCATPSADDRGLRPRCAA